MGKVLGVMTRLLKNEEMAANTEFKLVQERDRCSFLVGTRLCKLMELMQKNEVTIQPSSYPMRMFNT